MHRIIGMVFICLTALSACAQTGDTRAEPQISSKGSLAPASTEGGRWLKWNGETKLQYVEAYSLGFQRGFYQACKVAVKTMSAAAKSQESAFDECHRQVQRHSRYMEEYVQSITDYYSSYPDDLNVDISELLEGLSDSQHLTIQQMHEYYGPSAKKVPKR